ncbi:MAG: zinc-binding dehydrogenase [Proteobacteria bacterium]|nr:zinc-binding dehydrogenase [Pseudomonadota bacterium]MCP4919267.1 zinc-binding dehydrogenase [Pseudomonadota bacterium]
MSTSALVADRDGPPREVLELRPVPVELGAGQALCRVEASPIDPADLLAVRGLYPLAPPLPRVGGMQGVGRVEDPGDTGLSAGDRLLFPMRCGAWSTHVTVDAGRSFRLPLDVDPVQVCGMRINPPTADWLLRDLPAGSWVIVDPGTSAVGQLIAHLARARGLKTVAVIRRPSRAGATVADVVVHQGKGLARRVRAQVGEPIVRALDGTGGEHTERLASCLVPGGELVCFGAVSRQPAQISVRHTIFRDIRLRGFWLYRENQKDPAAEDALLDRCSSWFQDGTLQVEIAGTYGLEDMDAAFALAESPDRCGRVVFTP